MFLLRTIASVLLVTIAHSALAQNTVATKARTGLAALQCSFWAEKIKGGKSEQYFNLAIASLREFIEAAKAGRIASDDYRKNVPMIFGMRMGGPTTDFIVGRFFEATVDYTFDNTYCKKGRDKCDLDEDLQRMLAEQAYHQANCDLILK